MKIGVDPGNFKVKVVGPYGHMSFLSNLCEWFERNIEESFSENDMEFYINGRRGYAGTIAQIEDEYGGGNMMGNTKAHEDAKIRILLALHQYCNNGDSVYLVTGQPIEQHNPAEKDKIKKMLLGRHCYEVNNKTKTIFIEGVEIAPEGSAAIWGTQLPPGEKIRVLDIGSGTVNAATILDKKHVNTQSTTFNFGVETVSNKDIRAMARGIIKNASKKWGKHDLVYICGGVAEQITPFIREHFINARVLEPIHGGRILAPEFANAAGFYQLAKRRWN